jgi:hypothetical protein
MEHMTASLIAQQFLVVQWPPWVTMWLVAFGVYGGFKVFTWAEAEGWRRPAWISMAYLFAWPGMDARTFLAGVRNDRATLRPAASEWLFAFAKLALGLALLAVASLVRFEPAWLRGWLAMAGIAFVLHFGLFHVLSCFWRSLGIVAVPLMHWPIAATSLTEFWSRRWNLAFRDLTHRFVFRPLASRFGGVVALWVGFLLSGLVHDAVISGPAGGGYGLPTLFFLLQAGGMMIERKVLGRQNAARARGWLFTAAFLIVPAPLLFHTAFLNNVVLPFVDALGWLLEGATS